MAQTFSFDVTSTIDLQEVDNALNQARKEIGQRYDFKGVTAAIELDRRPTRADAHRRRRVQAERAVGDRADPAGPAQRAGEELQAGRPAAGGSAGTVRQVITLQQGIPIEAARDIVKFLKDKKLKKVQASIQGDQLRVTSPSKDELQAAMRRCATHDFGVALQFGNYRS